MKLEEVHLARAPAAPPFALGSFHCFLAEMHFVKAILPGASPLTNTGQESVGICRLPSL